MLRKIHLYGNLAESYGPEFTFDVNSVGEAIFALDANFPGFTNDIRKGTFHVLKGDIEDPLDLVKDKALLRFIYKDDDAFHIMPAIEGAGGDNGGWWTLIIGVILIAATYGAAAYGLIAYEGAAFSIGMGMGISLALSGIAQLLSPTPQIPSTGTEGEKEKPSFVFNGPVNRTEQGGPVTLVYGEIITGSIVCGGSIDIEEYA